MLTNCCGSGLVKRSAVRENSQVLSTHRASLRRFFGACALPNFQTVFGNLATLPNWSQESGTGNRAHQSGQSGNASPTLLDNLLPTFRRPPFEMYHFPSLQLPLRLFEGYISSRMSGECVDQIILQCVSYMSSNHFDDA